MPQVTGLSVRTALAILSGLGLKTRIDGGVKVCSQSPQPGAELQRGAICSLTGISSSREDNSYSMVTHSGRELNNSSHLQQIDREEK